MALGECMFVSNLKTRVSLAAAAAAASRQNWQMQQYHRVDFKVQ